MHFNLFFTSPKYAHSTKRGFGLIELMVSMTIMTLVSTVVLVKNKSFNNALLLRNQAYEIAFALRQTQLMAVSGTQQSVTDSKQFGIYFDFSAAGNVGSKFKIFRDDGTTAGRHDNNDTQLGAMGTIDSRFVISDIVGASGVAINGQEMTVSFVRPNFDALFKTNSSAYISGPIYINVSAKDNPTAVRQIEITNTGQISVI